jgi:hypothetical protein
MPLSRTTISIIIVIVIMVSLSSLAYPSVNVPSYNTETTINTSTYAQTLEIMYSISSFGLSYYYQTAVNSIYFPGDCWGSFIGPFPPCYYMIPRTSTKTLSTGFTVTSTSSSYTSTTSYTTYTNRLTHTSSQNIPTYAYLGLSSSQFVFIVALIIVLGCLAIVYPRREAVRSKLNQVIQAKC